MKFLSDEWMKANPVKAGAVGAAIVIGGALLGIGGIIGFIALLVTFLPIWLVVVAFVVLVLFIIVWSTLTASLKEEAALDAKLNERYPSSRGRTTPTPPKSIGSIPKPVWPPKSGDWPQ